jgi:hypothetical protein
MIQRLTHLNLMVHDQDKTVECFTRLGLSFYKHSDDMLGENARWITPGFEKQPGL